MAVVKMIRWMTGEASDPILHFHAGMFVLFAARMITRHPLSSPVPLLVVAAVQIGNEIVNRLYYGSWRPADTFLDTVNTLFWPTLLFIGLRLRKRVTCRRAAR